MDVKTNCTVETYWPPTVFFFACVRMLGVSRPKCGALTDISPASSS